MRVLVDVDGVLADFTGCVLEWAKGHPELKHYTFDTITQFDYLAAWGHPELQSSLDAWCSVPGRCLGLGVLPGARDMMTALREQGHEIVIVTSPYAAAPQWCYDRLLWLEREFQIPKRDVIFAKRKELIDGDVLIDDAFENVEAFAARGYPNRQAWLVDQPWNRAGHSHTCITRFYSQQHIADYTRNHNV